MAIENKILTFGTGKVGTVGGNKLMGWDTYFQAKAFIQEANITDPTQVTAINYLVKQLVDNNLMDKCKVIYPMIGGDATRHRYNLVDVGANLLTFIGGWTHGANGALPNGVNAYATTGFVPSTIAENNIHFSYYSRTNSQILNELVMGGSSSGAFPVTYLRIRDNGNQTLAVCGNTEANQPTVFGTLDSRGLFMGNFQSNTLRQLFKNKTLLNQSTVNLVLAKQTQQMYLSSYNNNNAPLTFTNKECAFASVGNGMTNVEQSLFYDIIQEYQTILGRNV